jgi:hypothetical protein
VRIFSYLIEKRERKSYDGDDKLFAKRNAKQITRKNLFIGISRVITSKKTFFFASDDTLNLLVTFPHFNFRFCRPQSINSCVAETKPCRVCNSIGDDK